MTQPLIYLASPYSDPDRLDILVAKSRKAQSDLLEAMAEIHELTRKGAK